MKYVFICFICLCKAVYAQTAIDSLAIIPAPARLVLKEGDFIIGTETAISYSDKKSRKTAGLLKSYLQKNYGINLPLLPNSQRSRQTIDFVSEIRNEKEAYRINITPSNLRVSGDDAGLFYGLQTLTQIIRYNGENVRIPCAEIDDKPRYPYRGIMQDVGYHIYPVSFIKSQIEMLAKYKMNVYHWHLTEDHGWRIEIKKYPKLTSVGAYRPSTPVANYTDSLNGADHLPYGGFYTQEEIKEVVAFAAERHVMVIPEIELPGHSLAALAAYPHLACGDDPGPFEVAHERWGIFKDVYCPGKETTFQFLEDVFTEVLELFPSPYIHIGGDEVPKDRWETCKHCQERMTDNDLDNELELQSYFVQRIEKFLNSRGRKIIGWDEILEGGLAPNATVMSWRGEAGGIAAAKQNHNVVMAPHTHLYLDYVQGKRESEPYAIFGSTNSISRIYHYDPTPKALPDEQKKYIIGVEAPIWTEYMSTYRKVEYMLYPRLMALSEIAWTTPKKKDAASFFEFRLPKHLAWLDTTDKLYRVPGPIGISDTTLTGSEFKIALKPPVEGAKIYYNFDGQEARETDFLYQQPIHIILHKGERRQLKTVVVTPSGKRSASTSTIFINP